MYNELLEIINKELPEEIEYTVRPELLLHPNLAKPLHSLNPRTLKGSKWWNDERRKAYAKNNYYCQCCGVYCAFDIDNKRFVSRDQQLEAHECYDIDYANHTAELHEIVALCSRCHMYIHSGMVQALYDKGQLDEQDCFEIFSHGDSVLIDAQISPFRKIVDTKTYKDEWDKWRLILDGKEYKSKFKNYEEWEKHYNKED